MKMPKVMTCSVDACAYNAENRCHALAITVGDPGGEPACDTYFRNDARGGDQDATAGVGACKVAGCQFNANFECSAANVSVGLEQGQADCMTYRAG